MLILLNSPRQLSRLKLDSGQFTCIQKANRKVSIINLFDNRGKIV